jgi:hypothetical protein
MVMAEESNGFVEVSKGHFKEYGQLTLEEVATFLYNRSYSRILDFAERNGIKGCGNKPRQQSSVCLMTNVCKFLSGLDNLLTADHFVTADQWVTDYDIGLAASRVIDDFDCKRLPTRFYADA